MRDPNETVTVKLTTAKQNWLTKKKTTETYNSWSWYALVDDEVGGEAEHAAVTLLVRPPPETEGHEEEPRALQQRHLVIQVQVTEAWTSQTKKTHNNQNTSNHILNSADDGDQSRAFICSLNWGVIITAAYYFNQPGG